MTVEITHESWRCRLTGHHRWVYPPESYESRETVSVQMCARTGCHAIRELVTPDTPQTPPLPLMAVRELIRLRKWNWGDPLDVDYPPRKEAADGP